ncbi:hypothetical protein DHEL01_v204993 [Diaporthe helianthi]|uniref:Uncharacterized protein n=1 Tax=Diaporthe helianthi TaxID=158607 RepID=A0A2P5I296_DIAHE|nr:hypothetical protein DHEL01_v204993 [Diaporthe helianthi]
MATRDVQILKNSGSVVIRCANANLRIPGFRLLEPCNTTVDMDQDPEVYMMLEPFFIPRYQNKATPNTDSRNSSRRLRFIFKAVIMFFQWRLPSGERMLRENGIDNLPDEVFQDIKAALVGSDPHFSRFSAMTIKRCLQLFTANVMDHARTLLPTGKGNTIVRDLAREAWESVKYFKAMLTQDWSTITVSDDSPTTQGGPPAPGPPAAGPPAAGPSNAGPSGTPSQNAQQSSSSNRIGEPSSSSAGTGTVGWQRVAPSEISSSATTTRGRGRGRGRGRATRKSGLNRQDNITLDGPGSRINTIASRATPEKRVTRSTKLSPAGALGKHPRAKPDLDEAKKARPAVLQKQYEKVFDATVAGRQDKEAWYEMEQKKYIAERHEWADKAWVSCATHKDLACEVLDLRRLVRTLEKEKEAGLSSQRQQLLPGLATMNMTPRVQERVNQLFPPTSNGSGESPSKAPWSYHAAWSTFPDTRTPHNVGIETWMQRIKNKAKPADDDLTLSAPWVETEDRSQEEAMQDQTQQEPKKSPGVPQIADFNHSTPLATKINDMLASNNLGSETVRPKKWKYKQFDWEAKTWNYFDSDNESDVPTESSWASTIPA